MAKYKMLHALSAMALLVGSGIAAPLGAFAEGDTTTLESCDGIEKCAVVTSTEELSTALTNKDSVILVGGSFDLTADLFPDYDFTLYLNNNTISSNGLSFVPYGKMTINAGENGSIRETGGEWAPFYVHGGLVLNSGTIETAGTAVYVTDDGAEFTMNGGTITGGNSSSSTVVVTDGAKMTMDGGTINGDTWGVSAFKNTEFTMNGGDIIVNSDSGIGIAGNGSASGANEGTNARLILNGGTVTSNDLGIYAPQINGETILGADLTINAGKCGVEIRAGELTVDGATINVDEGAEYAFNPNGSGSTASGVAIAVAQHTTKQAITATVNDGVFTAPVAFAEGNPQVNPDEDIKKVELSITGGTFNATNGEPVVASEDVTGFVTGGIFNKDLDAKYVADGYVSASDDVEGVYVVVDPNNMDDPNNEVDTRLNYETNEEEHYIAPKVIDYNQDYVETDYEDENQLSAFVEFNKELIADRKATLSATAVEDSGNLALAGDGELIGAFEINMLDRNGANIEVKDNDLRVVIDIDEEAYNKLAAYDKIYAVYFNADGAEEERIEATLNKEDDSYTNPETGETESWSYYWIEFRTSHLSTYGIVGVNGDSETAEGGEAEGSSASTPQTGTVTMAGASASIAAVFTSVVIGIMTSVVSFAYLIRRR